MITILGSNVNMIGGGGGEVYDYLNLMVGPRCPIMHRFSHKARVKVKNDRLKPIKSVLSLSQHLVHNVMLEVGFYFQLLTMTTTCS